MNQIKNFFLRFSLFLRGVLTKERNLFNSPYPITLYGGVKSPRGCDDGCGHFGANRSDHTHQGQDYLCEPGTYVFAPFDGTIIRTANPYPNDPKYKGFLFDFGNGVQMKVFYAIPVGTGVDVKKGDIIAICQDISQKYANVAPHIHVEIEDQGKKVNPIYYI